MEERNIEEANRRLQRAEAIIDELRNTLNPGRRRDHREPPRDLLVLACAT